jgi:hypothetical protein
MHSEKVLWAYQIMLVADDALAVTTSQRLIRFYDDDIEHAQRWVRDMSRGAILYRAAMASATAIVMASQVTIAVEVFPGEADAGPVNYC